MSFHRRTELHRRHFLTGLGIGAMGILAGCTADDNGAGDSEDDSDGRGDDDGTPRGDDSDSDDQPTELEPSGSYTAAHHTTFTTFNPIYNTEAGAGTAIGLALDQGFTFTPDEEVFPLHYDLWTEDEGNVWVFEVRDGLEFSDPYGQVDAESYVYQIQELHQGGMGTANTNDWDGVEVVQTGELEFQAELPEPNLLWPETFAPLEYPIPIELVEPYVEEEDVDGLQQNEELNELTFTGNLGPYVLESWDRGNSVSYVRNDDYFLQNIDDGPDLFENAPYFEEASIHILEEQAARLGALETGEVDYAGIPPQRVDDYREMDEIDVYQVPQPYNRVVSVNMRDNGWNAGPGNLFRVKEFRQALTCAIGKEDLIAGIYRGYANPHFTWQPEWTQWYPEDRDIPQFGVGDLYGEDVAKGLAEDAIDQIDEDYGYDGGVLLNPDGEQVILDLAWADTSQTNQLLSEYVAQEVEANLGIEVNRDTVEGTYFNNEMWVGEPEGGTDTIGGEEYEWPETSPWNPGPRSVTSNEGWDMSIIFGLNTYPRNPLENAVFFDGPTTLYNPVGYYPEFDAQEIFSRARNATEIEELQEAFADLFVNLAEEQPYIMMNFTDDIEGYRAGLEGPIEDFANGWDFPAWHFPE